MSNLWIVLEDGRILTSSIIFTFLNPSLLCWRSSESKELNQKEACQRLISRKIIFYFCFFSVLTVKPLRSDLCMKAGHWGNSRLQTRSISHRLDLQGLSNSAHFSSRDVSLKPTPRGAGNHCECLLLRNDRGTQQLMQWWAKGSCSSTMQTSRLIYT